MKKSIFLFILGLFIFQIQAEAQDSRNVIHADLSTILLGGAINRKLRTPLL